MTAFRQKVTVKRGGVINLRSQSLKAGDTAEVIVLVENGKKKAKTMTAADLLQSNLFGIWADRKDIGDSLEFARSLRRQAEQRGKTQ
ncbi:MAG: hypothetical protein A3K41_07270 [Chloroflexi bacterium RIFOXYD12_FULL_57_15]|nr:MAG: hypothetical protein A3K41_07270 [Chloroflexi bacterium RIFOXYD12_FULL_57_15]